MNDEQEKFYNNSQVYFDTIKDHEGDYFDEYIDFVKYYVKDLNNVILDVGCGAGQSTKYLSEAGYRVTGVDGGKRFIDYAKGKHGNCSYYCEDAGKMSFGSDSFDVVASYNTVEHLDDAEGVLMEMIRVVKKGGYVLVNSPNLLSVWHPINALIRFKGMTFEGRKNYLQLLSIFFRNIFLILKKSIDGRVRFIYRKPELNFTFPDNDATWYLNPIDVRKFFEKNGCEIISYQRLSHVKSERGKFSLLLVYFFPGIMGITRIVAKKL